MNTKSVIRNVLFLSVFLGAAVILPYQEVIAQGERPLSTPDSRVSRELWDVWRQGFDYYEKGEMRMISTKYQEALLYYQKALESFQEVRRQNPRWNRSVIDYRMNLCRRRILTAQRRSREAAENARAAMERSRVDLSSAVRRQNRSVSAAASSAAGRDFEIRLAQTSRENELRRKQIADLQAELARLRPDAAKADSAMRQIRSLIREREQLDRQLSSLRLQFRALQEEQRKAAPRTAELQKMLETERNKTSAYARAFREKNTAFNKLEEQFKILSAGKSQLDGEYARLRKQYETLQRSSDSMVQRNAAQLNALKQSLDTVRKESAARQSELDKTRNQMRTLSAQLSDLRSGKLTSEENVKQIRKDFALLRAAQDKDRIELEKLRAERIRLENQCVVLSGQIAGLKKDLARNMVQRNDFAKANDAISKQYAALEKSFRKSTAENAALRKDLAKAVRERELFASKVNDQLNESLKAGLRSAQQQVNALRQELSALKKQGNALELKAALAVSQSKVLASQQEKNTLKGQLAAVQERSARAEQALKASQAQLQSVQQQFDQFRKTHSSVQSRIHTLQQENRDLAQKLKTQSENALRDMIALQRKESQARAALDEALKKQMLLNKSQSERLRSSNQTIRQLTETLRSQNDRLAKALAESEVLKQQKNLLQSKVDQEKLLVETKKGQLEERAKGLSKQNSELQEALRRKEAELAALRKTSSAPAVDPAGKKSSEAEKENVRLLKEEIASLRTRIRELSRKEKVLEKQTAQQAKITALTASLDKARKQSEQAEKKVAECQAKIQRLTLTLEKNERALQESRDKYTTLSKQSASDSSRILKLQEEIMVLRKDMTSSRKNAADAQSSSAVAKARIQTLQGELASVRELRAVQEKELKAVRRELEIVRREFALVKGRLETALKNLASERKRAAARRNEVVQLQKKVVDLHKMISTLRKNLLATGRERSALVKDLDKLKASLPMKEELASLRKTAEKSKDDAVQLRKEKAALEQTISSLQFRLGSTQRLLEKVRSEALKQGTRIRDLTKENLQLKKRTGQAASLEKSLAEVREERSRLIRNAAVAENRLKTQLRAYAGELLALRDKAAQQQETIRQRNEKILSQQRALNRSAGKIKDLEKKLADALSGEERARLLRQIREMTRTLKVLASKSPDELVREAASKNVVITELLTEIETYKKELAQMKKTVTDNNNLVLRSREALLRAEDAARVAVEGARLARGELARLKADVLAGTVNVVLLERSAPKVKITAGGKISGKKNVWVNRQSRKPSAEKSEKSAAEEKLLTDKDKKETVSSVDKTSSSVKKDDRKEIKKTKLSPEMKKYEEIIAQGISSEKSGDLGMALFHYWSAVDVLPENPKAYLMLVKLHLKRKEGESAQKAYDKAVSLGALKDKALEEQIRKVEE